MGDYFKNNAPLTSEQAATIILDGVRKEEWRILVGDDAHRIDDACRRDPHAVYEGDFSLSTLLPGSWTSNCRPNSRPTSTSSTTFIEREIKPLEEAGRQHPLLRPPARGRAHRLGTWRSAERGVGGAAARGPAPRRCRRSLPLPVPEGVRRQGRHQPRHGGDPRAPRAQGARAAQRPAERALDRRQQRRAVADDQLRHRRAEGRVDRRPSPKAARGFAFGITEPAHGSDATHMETTAVRDGDEWIINGEKTWNTGMHAAPYDLIFARTSGKAGDGDGITAFLVPTDSPGFEIVEFLWTFNMPTDHAHIRLTDVRVPHSAIFGGEDTRPAGHAALLQREPHPPGRVEPRCRRVLHRPGGRVRQGARAVRQAAVARTRRSSSRSSSCRRSARCCAR